MVIHTAYGKIELQFCREAIMTHVRHIWGYSTDAAGPRAIGKREQKDAARHHANN